MTTVVKGQCHQLKVSISNSKRQKVGVKINENANLQIFLREAVMLLLRGVEIGNIVEEQLLHRIGAEMLQLSAGTLEQDPFERSDLAFDTNWHIVPPACDFLFFANLFSL